MQFVVKRSPCIYLVNKMLKGDPKKGFSILQSLTTHLTSSRNCFKPSGSGHWNLNKDFTLRWNEADQATEPLTLISNTHWAQCLKIDQKVAFNIASEASYLYISSGLKFIKNAKNGQFVDFLKIWSLRSNSVTRRVNFNWTKIGEKCQ